MRALHMWTGGVGRSLATFWRRRKVAAHVRQGRAGDRSRRAFGQMRIVASAAILESARASNPLAKQISNHPWERHRTAVDRRSRT